MGFHIGEVQRCLAGVDFRGTPHDLADHARDRGADEVLVDALRRLNRGSFDGVHDVLQALGDQQPPPYPPPRKEPGGPDQHGPKH